MANYFTTNQGTETGSPYIFPEKGNAKEQKELTIEFFRDLHKRTETIESSLDEIQKKNTQQNNRNIEILAVFVTLFTFISIETQMLRSGISFLTAVGFSLLILGGLMMFLFTLRFFLENDWKSFHQFLLLLVVGLITIGAGLGVIWQGQKAYFSDIDKRFYGKEEVNQMLEDVRAPFFEFKECIVKGLTMSACARLIP